MELLVKMDIVYEDKDKIILNKPAGQLSQSGKSFEMDLVSEVLTYRKSKGEEAYAAIINRFDLLTFLAEHPNHVYTKEELFKEIWDMDSIGDIATVTVHIKKIREKIELDTSKPQYIETIWGVGYRFKL